MSWDVICGKKKKKRCVMGCLDSYPIPCKLRSQDAYVVKGLHKVLFATTKTFNTDFLEVIASFKWRKVTFSLVLIQIGTHHFLIKWGKSLYFRGDLSVVKMKRVTLLVVCRGWSRKNTVSLFFDRKWVKTNKVGLKQVKSAVLLPHAVLLEMRDAIDVKKYRQKDMKDVKMWKLETFKRILSCALVYLKL